MTTAEQILLLILAGALAVFLIIGIVALTQLIRLLKLLQEIAQKADNLVDSAEAAAVMVKDTVGRLSLLRFLRSILDLVHSNDKKGKR